jgi:hypothetical protein
MVCSEQYIFSPLSKKCEYCDLGKPDMTYAVTGLFIVCVVIFLIVFLIVFFAKVDNREDMGECMDDFEVEKEREKAELLDQITIMMSWAQILSSIPLTYDGVLWPRDFRTFSLGASIVEIDLSRYFPLVHCQLAIPFLKKFYIHLATPPAIALSAKLAQALVHLCSKLYRRGDSMAQRSARGAIADKCIIFMFMMLYPGLSRRIFQVFRCHDMSEIGQSRLYHDYSIKCWEKDGEHGPAVFLAVLGIIFFSVGMPLAMFYGLWQNRSSLHDKSHPRHRDTLRRFGFLYSSYEPAFWWWEIVIICQKCFMTSVLVVISPRSPMQLVVALLASMVYMSVVLRAGPYVGDHEDVLSFLASTSLSLTMLAGLAKITDMGARTHATPDDLVREDTLSLLLIATNIVPLAYFVTIVAMRCVLRKKIRKRRRETRRLTENNTDPQRAAVLGGGGLLQHTPVQIVPLVHTHTASPGLGGLLDEELSHEEHAERVLRNYHAHEDDLEKMHAIRKKKSARKTQLRLIARTKVKSSRALSRVPAFSRLSECAISKIVDVMSYESFASGSVLCSEGETADRMFILVSGTCRVMTSAQAHITNRRTPVAELKEFDIVGESMMCKDPTERVRNATVTANATGEEKAFMERGGSDIVNSWTKSGVQVLVLYRRDYDALVKSGVIDEHVQSAVISVGTARRNENRENFVASRTLGAIRRKNSGGDGGGGMSKEKLTATSIRAWNLKTATEASDEAKVEVPVALQETLLEADDAETETQSGRHEQDRPGLSDVDTGPA